MRLRARLIWARMLARRACSGQAGRSRPRPHTGKVFHSLCPDRGKSRLFSLLLGKLPTVPHSLGFFLHLCVLWPRAACLCPHFAFLLSHFAPHRARQLAFCPTIPRKSRFFTAAHTKKPRASLHGAFDGRGQPPGEIRSTDPIRPRLRHSLRKYSCLSWPAQPARSAPLQ